MELKEATSTLNNAPTGSSHRDTPGRPGAENAASAKNTADKKGEGDGTLEKIDEKPSSKRTDSVPSSRKASKRESKKSHKVE